MICAIWLKPLARGPYDKRYRFVDKVAEVGRRRRRSWSEKERRIAN